MEAYFNFALGNPHAYRIMFDIDAPIDDTHPELAAAADHAARYITRGAEQMRAAGLIDVDPQLFGWSMWATLHGIVMLHQSGMLAHGPDHKALAAFHGVLMMRGAAGKKTGEEEGFLMAGEDDVTLFGKLKSKLIETKQKWAEDGRLLTGHDAAPGERLPPGQRLVENWPVLDLGIQPEIPTHAWRLFVDGEVEQPLTWKWDEFTALPRTTLTNDIHCVTAWSRYDNVWEGVSARDLIARVRPKAEAQHVIFHSYDTYKTNVPLADFRPRTCCWLGAGTASRSAANMAGRCAW